MSTALRPCYTVTISGPDPLQKKKQQLSFHQVHLRAYICEINDACAGIRVVQFCTHNAQCRDTLSLMAARNKQHAGNVFHEGYECMLIIVEQSTILLQPVTAGALRRQRRFAPGTVSTAHLCLCRAEMGSAQRLSAQPASSCQTTILPSLSSPQHRWRHF